MVALTGILIFITVVPTGAVLYHHRVVMPKPKKDLDKSN